ncbi:MAG TPA: hypothetical protein VKW04_09375 [Planctomycetota bacterium]|nr:hypothetical protein [Planctomycetota bacterium]
MAGSEGPVAPILWVLCVPDPARARRIIPFLCGTRGTLWFSEPQYIDRYIREHPALPRGARARAVVGRERLLAFARALLRARVETLYLDLEAGKEAPGQPLSAYVASLEDERTRAVHLPAASAPDSGAAGTPLPTSLAAPPLGSGGWLE